MKTRIKSIVIVITLLFLGLLPKMQAVSPAPDGCYPGFTTAEGCNALQHLATGARNTAVGTDALVFNNSGVRNTAVGAFALYNNLDGLVNTAIGDNVLFNNTHG